MDQARQPGYETGVLRLSHPAKRGSGELGSRQLAAAGAAGATSHATVRFDDQITMKQKKWTVAQGPIPGSGRWQQTISTRPDDPGLVSRAQMKELVGVSNPAVITRALERLSIDPVSSGSKSVKTTNKGGSGNRAFEVPYYTASATEAVRQELKGHTQPIGDGRFSYEGVTFRWKAAD
jgi:hypothetical protein